jgi:small subunit ribosomal protein S3
LGHKVHPIGFRIGITTDWRSRWYSQKAYTEFVQEDIQIRGAVLARTEEAGVSRVDIERWANDVVVTVHAAKPGIVIGRGGQRVDELRNVIEGLCGKRIRLNIHEVREPELDAFLVAKSVASQMEHQIAYRRAIKRSIMRTMQAGAKGVKVICSGRLGGAEIARRVTFREGRVPLHTLRADIDYGFCEARTLLGRIGVKVWIYKGEVLPQLGELEVPASQPVATGPVSQGKGALPPERPIEVGENVTAKEGQVPEGTKG